MHQIRTVKCMKKEKMDFHVELLKQIDQLSEYHDEFCDDNNSTLEKDGAEPQLLNKERPE